MVWLSNAWAMVQVVGGWPADFWHLLCRAAVKVVVVCGGYDYVAAVAEVGEEFGCNAEVVVEDEYWGGAAFSRPEVLVSALAEEECRWCTIAS
jgi:hypothetical protein